MTNAVEREIVELHGFFEGWLNGDLPAEEDEFARFADVLAPWFHIISPDGEIAARDELVRGIRGAQGRRPGLRIEVRNVVIRRDEAPWLLATYEEWQREPGSADTARICTALFRRRFGLPQGLQWQHVHETWIGG